ncbi:5595_t:CDS:2 [Cetraspora pellucida]|uniref:5595_t:CDS:1 n=1 Tax=Cetraspora pellucida TaxID=1433469 RepID=A0A9N9AHV0_9GLOM|nr:5595_t:CDS:2 [Cetraspora pellucida]
MKNKPVPKGFKIFSLYESSYTYTFLPTSCVAENDVPKVNGLSKVGVPLFQYLQQIGIGVCRTIQKTTSRFPKALKVDKNIKLNWDIHSGVKINNTLMIFWQDNGSVTMLSTIYSLVDEEWEVEQE